ncbi:polyhydroxyalkanoic acid system family protein [Hephaestia sp. GCM10023244]|uniref:polyhydroxyalkanoic acid system family protein n=1 Tax=unclassified Hephaestia TaxID=2631281 RepID=UPI002076DF85|nr:polyhydroxyalkanoic acid system family protein [Hephaestia sp. MAHUQ-44]MCM8730759.1 polyhydroxyalkanoic acid system family protein [Hephaestia sp. MAHUQ-44]
MTEPVAVDLPHRLGKAVARGRIERGVGKIARFVPGGAITDHRWEGDVMHFTVEAMGQRIASRLDVQDANVHAEFDLPGILGMFGNQLRGVLQKEGPKLLE